MTGRVRKLFVHVGPPKTGTSAVQHIFRTYESATVLYPKQGRWADGSHHNLVLNFYHDTSRPELIRADPGEMLDAIAGEAREREGNLLISSEILATRDVASFLGALLGRLGGGWEAEIVLACREHFEMASSLYNQAVKDPVHRRRDSPDDFLRTSSFTFAPLVRRLKSTGVPVKALNYHPAESFVSRFLAHVGFSVSEPVTVERRNLSLSTKGLIAMLAANNVAQSTEEATQNLTLLRRMRPFFASSRFIFSRAAAEAADVLFREDRRFVRDEFGIELPRPDLAAQENGFFIDARELADIAAASRELGPQGQAIVDFARRYVRSIPG